jgi:type II secretory pathway predicted ATPase ExeA
MNSKKLLGLYGLKWNPFLPDIPIEALWVPKEIEHFSYRVENLVMDGGFAMVCAEPGMGKSKTLQILTRKLASITDVVVGVMERPQSTLGDFYRELGEIFAVNLSPANRYGGFKALREKWKGHIQTTLFRPVLLIDEAQEMPVVCLNEIRMLASIQFDSKSLLSTVIAGDMRLPDRFRCPQLVSLGTRVRVRLLIEPYEKPMLIDYMNHAMEQAGAAHLMTKGLKQTLVEHCAGNLRILNCMSAELLITAAQKELPQLDEKLFFDLFSKTGGRK